jgi:negative regulator of flagellin synthesis FlgM
MHVIGVSAASGSQATSGLSGVEQAGSVKAAASRDVGEVRDTVAVSVDSVSHDSGIRMDRVNEIRSAIAQGTYETPEKLEIALDRLLESIG